MAISHKFMALGLAWAVGLGTLVSLPTSAAQAAESCNEGSRKIKASDMREVEALFIDGSLGSAEITLRHSPSQDCAWGLLEGTGEIWIERKSQWGTFDRLYHRQLDDRSITHTAAVIIGNGPMRVCGNTFDGSTTDSAGIGTDGRAISTTISSGRTVSRTQPRCTQSLGGPM